MRVPSSSASSSISARPALCISRPSLRFLPKEMAMSLPTEHLINELQSHGVRLVDPKAGVESRRGGAGPSDHKAITIDGITVMVPVHTAPAFDSPYVAEAPDADGNGRITRNGIAFGTISFPKRPRFYGLTTEDGVPYSKIA